MELQQEPENEIDFTTGEQLRRLRSQSSDRVASGGELQAVLTRIWREAVFFGRPSIAEHARLLIEATGDGSTAVNSKDSVKALFGCLDLLQNLLEEPLSQSLVDESKERIESLRALAQPEKGGTSIWQSNVDFESSVDGGFDENEASTVHTDIDIYSNDFFNGLESCSGEESWTASQLDATIEDLAKLGNRIRPAQQLMRIFAGHQFFQQVDRVCIVGLMPRSNHLTIVDTSQHARMRDQGPRSPMVPGYSCFVNPTGSLAKMRPGVMRIFGDSRSVLKSLASEGKPAQRSISYLAETGLRSGICLAIGRGDSVQGYLFLNSLQPDLFGNVMRDYGSLLSLFSLLGSVALEDAGFHAKTNQIAPTEGDVPSCSERFESEASSEYLAALVEGHTGVSPQVQVSLNSEAEFLYAPEFILGTLSEAAFRLGLTPIGQASQVEVEIELKGKEIVFELSADSTFDSMPSDWRERRMDGIEQTLHNRPARLELTENGVAICFPFEPVLWKDGDIRYSVAF